MSQTQSTTLLVTLGAVIGLFGVTYFNSSSASESSRAQCLARNTAARCECIITTLESEWSFFAYIPVVGQFFEPPASRREAAKQRAMRLC